MANDRGAGRKSTLTTEQIENARNRYEAGESIAQIAAEYGISRQGLYKRLREDKQAKEIKIDYVLEGELCTTISIYINDNRLRVFNYATQLSKRAFGWNENPSWEEFRDFLERQYLLAKGIDAERVNNCFLCSDKKISSISVSDIAENDAESELIIDDAVKDFIPSFEFKRKDILIIRTDTDGFQLKAITSDRKWFVKAQAEMGGTIMNDWAVEIIASNICKQLKIDCVEQKHCEFVYEGRKRNGVFSRNFELDGLTFISFERLLEYKGISSRSEEFIHLNAIEKMKWCANILSSFGKVAFADALKYMLDLAMIDCLVGNVDRHMKNFGLFFNNTINEWMIGPAFDNGMGLFEHDYYRDRYESYESAMNNVYIAPYGEDPFEMIDMLSKEFNLGKIYPGLKEFEYTNELTTEYAKEYERRMIAHVRGKINK